MIRRPPRSTRTDTLSLHDALPILYAGRSGAPASSVPRSTNLRTAATPLFSSFGVSAPHQEPKLRSEEHTSELQSLMRISYAVFCLKKKKQRSTYNTYYNHDDHTSHY